jgi:RHS repeat-associated protein
LVRPGDTAAFPTVEYDRRENELPVRVHTRRRRRQGAAGVYEKVVFYDGFGRQIQERVRVDGERVRVSGAVAYTPKGEPASKGLPHFREGLAFEPPAALPPTPRFLYTYDGIGRLATATNTEGRQIRVRYTPWAAFHNDVLDTDPAHPHRDTPRIEHFDALGRLAGVTRQSAPGVGHRVRYTYDLVGRLLSTTDMEGRPALISAVYDARGARLRFTHAGCGTRTALYDAAGRVVRCQDDRGQTVERTFDALGRILTAGAGGAVEERYHWDEAPAGPGRLHRVEDRAGAVTFAYDPQGRLTRKVREIGGQAYTLEYAYDGAGLQARQVYPDGTAVAFERWEDGRVRSLGGFIEQADWDAQGRLTGLRHANGVVESFTYDGSSYLSEMRAARGGQTLRHTRLTHDGAGHLKRHEELAGLHPGVEIYEHDALERLTGFRTERDGDIEDRAYAYDADGNLLRADEMDAELYEYDFAAPGFLKRRRRTGGAIEEFGFDAAGHMTSMPGQELAFDAHGRLVRVTKADGTRIEMVYDYRGARVAKKVTGSPEGDYEVCYIDDLYEERQRLGTAWIYLSGRLAGQRRGGGTRHLHTDHRGSVVLATRPNGAADLRAWFGPFGLGETLPAGEVSRQMGSAVLDSETGLYYFNHRYYSPSLGRFLSPDPLFLGQPERELDLPQAHNLYAYAANDPVDYTDPTGLGFWSDFGKVLAGIVAVVAVVVAVVVLAVVVAAAMASGGWAIVLGATVVGAIIGGIQGGWEGALLGAMIGFSAGINMSIMGPLGVITFLGVFKEIRQQGWYKSIAGWTSWFMPASWPGHILGLGVFLANGIAHISGSDKQIEKVKFDWEHGQIITGGGEYGGSMLPFLIKGGPAHNLGGFSFISNERWNSEDRNRSIEHETGHMLSNAVFGFWQGVVQVVQQGKGHEDRLFEKIAESNAEEEGKQRESGRELPFWG